MRRPVTVGAVLAGGESSRMGTPKALLELASRPMLSRIVATVGSAGLEPVVVAKPDSPLPRLDCRVLSEPTEPRHPLTGLIAALGASAGRGVVAVACDMPLVPVKLFAWIAQLEAEVAVCEVAGRLEPLLGRYSPAISDRLANSLAAGASMRDAVAGLDPHVISESDVGRFGDPERIFFNVNSPADAAAAERMLNRTGRFSLRMRSRLSPSDEGAETARP